MKSQKITLLALAFGALSFSSCREQKTETPNENYEMNHKTEEAPDSAFSTTDSITSNSTQTDPAAND